MKYFLTLFYIAHTIAGLYTYDRFNNRPIVIDTSFENVYYTSSNFHSVEFTDCKLRNNTKTYRLKPFLKLRPNSTQSLPNLYQI